MSSRRPMLSGEAACYLQVGTQRLHQLDSELRPTLTRGGVRLYDPDAVKRLAEERDAARSRAYNERYARVLRVLAVQTKPMAVETLSDLARMAPNTVRAVLGELATYGVERIWNGCRSAGWVINDHARKVLAEYEAELAAAQDPAPAERPTPHVT